MARKVRRPDSSSASPTIDDRNISGQDIQQYTVITPHTRAMRDTVGCLEPEKKDEGRVDMEQVALQQTLVAGQRQCGQVNGQYTDQHEVSTQRWTD